MKTIRSLPTTSRRRRQRGSYLLEALIAMLIFAFGVLGLIGLLGSSIRVTNDARYRAEASQIASAMISDMWTMTSAQMDTDFGSGGTKLSTWQTKAAALLPSADAHPPTVDLAQPGLSAESRTVVVKVYWRAPGDTELHQYVMTGQIGKNRFGP
jgi:type IV pilus assembly protein PilV